MSVIIVAYNHNVMVNYLHIVHFVIMYFAVCFIINTAVHTPWAAILPLGVSSVRCPVLVLKINKRR